MRTYFQVRRYKITKRSCPHFQNIWVSSLVKASRLSIEIEPRHGCVSHIFKHAYRTFMSIQAYVSKVGYGHQTRGSLVFPSNKHLVLRKTGPKVWSLFAWQICPWLASCHYSTTILLAKKSQVVCFGVNSSMWLKKIFCNDNFISMPFFVPQAHAHPCIYNNVKFISCYSNVQAWVNVTTPHYAIMFIHLNIRKLHAQSINV